MFKTQVEPRAAGEWFHCKVLNILWRHFYGLYECRPWKIVVDLLSGVEILSFPDSDVVICRQNFLEFFIFYEKVEQPAVRDMLRHFHGVYSH